MVAAAHQTESWATKMGLAILTGIAVTFVSTPASATDGRTAVGMCIDSTASGARCAWSVNDKGEIDICNQNGCVTCPSATEECTVAKTGREQPTMSLPVGTQVVTKLGTFEVRAPCDPMYALMKAPSKTTK
jgi:hypothetical protein